MNENGMVCNSASHFCDAFILFLYIISATIVFADLRGYTSLSQNMDASTVNDLLNCFYDHCSSAVWEHDGIVNKFIGDAVLAIFYFPLERPDHVRKAVLSGIELQKKCVDIATQIGLDHDLDVGVGVGIHTGTASIGEIGTAYKEFTAIGPVVNLASRVQGSAKAGEIVVTEPVYHEIHASYPDLEKRTLTLKGIEHPVDAYIISPT